jgi:hypothetical protein
MSGAQTGTLAGVLSAHIGLTLSIGVALIRARERLARLEGQFEILLRGSKDKSDAKRDG